MRERVEHKLTSFTALLSAALLAGEAFGKAERKRNETKKVGEMLKIMQSHGNNINNYESSNTSAARCGLALALNGTPLMTQLTQTHSGGAFAMDRYGYSMIVTHSQMVFKEFQLA